MNTEELNFKELNELAENKQFKKLRDELMERNDVDAAAFISQLDPEKILVVFRTLPKDFASDVFSRLEIEKQSEIILSISDLELKKIVEDLALDDAVDMIEELPANLVKRILMSATKDTRDMINQYLKYPDNSAGTVMTCEYVALKKNMNVGEALQYIRNHATEKETIYTCYVINLQRELEGVVTLKDMVLAEPQKSLSDVMDDHVIKALTTDDREEITALFNKYDLLALPVVDMENRLVGIITVDDAFDVMEQEATEDFQKMAAMNPSEKPYLKTSVFSLAKNRIVWLLVLMISAMFTGGILEKYEKAFSVIPLLVTFIPMITDTGGNAGSQSSTMIIRGMVLGEIQTKDIFRVIWKELRVATICGIVLGAANFVRLMILYPGNTLICLTVVLSLFVTVILAKTIGGILPIIARSLKLDPAIMAAPLITTIVDACSLILYFEIATKLLGL